MFDCHELQILVAGDEGEIDIEDLRRNTIIVLLDFTEDHPGIHMFWSVVRSFTEEQKKKLLKFVTSCSRPPLLGFKDLYPSFCIQLLPNVNNRLPTSATCMNLLKLPYFNDEQTLREKLLYAIDFDSGFELS
ncbi:unnamed protein product [Soboliphyme baturini]|uniref:HECT-type E3 ubiquitin transferase n=1 Tax=Soboliphyme baturini TaxID=241478 RepID=A0A183IZS6_9BILA|nr:unnamed protein product [Soboliphyme baturini]